jgi:sec-independent protein translocase protein TatA
MFGLDFRELIILGIVAVMLFGRRLPEVARSLGKSYNQFKKGINDIKREMDDVVYTTRSEVRSATSHLLTYDEDALPSPSVPPFQPAGAIEAAPPGETTSSSPSENLVPTESSPSPDPKGD